ncbi:MAG: NAD-dependent epimerase/dehydratase family protein [Flavobacteriales bacterium]
MIDKNKPILVTGANGYVASWLVKKLLDEGLTVHAAVRNPKDESKVGHLVNLVKDTVGELKLFSADLLKAGSYKEAMQGCELVYHTASPFFTEVKNPVTELIEPAVNGTENVLLSAKEVESVKRVVVTSSCAAIYTDAIDTINAPGGRITEEIWNTTASLKYQPYSLSKTLAEKKAWEISQTQDKWDLVTLNMSLVMGPPLNPKANCESSNILIMLGGGKMKMGVPKMGIGIVDVRDVAETHFRAGFYKNANGRYITFGHETDFLELGLVLGQKYSHNYLLPKKALPKWLLMLVGPFVHSLFSRKFIRNNINVAWRADNSKVKKDLDMTFRPLKETMEDAFQQMIDAGIIKAK